MVELSGLGYMKWVWSIVVIVLLEGIMQLWVMYKIVSLCLVLMHKKPPSPSQFGLKYTNILYPDAKFWASPWIGPKLLISGLLKMSGGSRLEPVICHVSATVQPNEWVEVLVCKVFVEGGSWYCNWRMCSCCEEMYHHLVVASAFWDLMWFSRSQQN